MIDRNERSQECRDRIDCSWYIGIGIWQFQLYKRNPGSQIWADRVVSKGKADGYDTDMGRGRDNSDWHLTPSFWSQKKLIVADHFSLIGRKLFSDGELMRG